MAVVGMWVFGQDWVKVSSQKKMLFRAVILRKALLVENGTGNDFTTKWCVSAS